MEGTFYNCKSLVTASVIPESVTNLSYTFSQCTSLTGTIYINANPTEYTYCFYGINLDRQSITLAGTSTMLDKIKAAK